MSKDEPQKGDTLKGSDSQLLYLPPPEEVMDIFRKEETMGEKMNRKFRENPFVPIGAGVTALVLTAGLYSMSKGKTRMSQKMMRARVLAQGFTIVAMMGGVVYSTKK